MKTQTSFLTAILAIATIGDLSAQSAPVSISKHLRAPRQTESVPATPPAARAAVTGDVEVVVRLNKPPLAARQADTAARGVASLNAASQRSYLGELNADQSALMGQLSNLGGRKLAGLNKALNAVVVTVDAKQMPAIAKLPGVASVRIVRNYEKHLDETVPYIGAAAAQDSGFTGAGVVVAVLDSGADYTHGNLGGPGTLAAYDAAYGTSTSDPRNQTLDGLFPTAKVIGGFDFVGEEWPFGPTVDDPDPIALDSHGTHVSDIIAGESADGTHVGVAPGAKIVAVKVCSSVSPSCNGVALLRAVDFILDPDGDGDISDRVDMVNLSLGSSYGQMEDDLSGALANASRIGITVVASAGNSADRPYIVGSPSSTQEVISVAQTAVPSAQRFALVINSPGSIAGTYRNTNSVDFAPVVGITTADVLYVGRGCPAAGATPADPLPTGVTEANVAGRIALIDRGACAVSLKIDRFAKIGAVGVLIANNASGDPPSFSFGGPDDFTPAPTLIIQNTLGFGSTSLLRQALANGPVNATISDQNVTALIGSIVASSSRGPNISFNEIKPDIGAPGGSVSAEAGTGTGESAFGGTSGAAPMVAGSAALLKEGFFDASPSTIKSLLMNNAFRGILTNPATQPGVLAPITRIGAGEVRVDRSLNANAIAFVPGSPGSPDQPSLSFGFHRLSSPRTFTQTVRVQNFLAQSRTFNVSREFRFADDASSAAVNVSVPSSITVPGRRSADFTVTLTVNASLLPTWTLNGGSRGGDGFRLQGVEFDGFIRITESGDAAKPANGAGDDMALPFHILPHKAAGTRAGTSKAKLNRGPASIPMSNSPGAIAGATDVFNLIGTSPRVPVSSVPKEGENRAVIDMQSVGVREVNFGTEAAPALGLQFLITAFDQRPHPNYPAGFEVDIDTTGDGVADFFVFNRENGAFASSGQNVVAVQKAGATTASIQFFTDADLNSANVIFSVLYSQLELPNVSHAKSLGIEFFAFDNYFTGDVTDFIGGITYTPATPRYTGSLTVNPVPIGFKTSTLNISAVPGGAAASPSQTGILLNYRDARSKLESQAITVSP